MAEAMVFTADNVEKAISNFYCNDSRQQHIDRWLTAAQISTDAWSFCWQLLSPEKDLQVQYFGASCLHVKISKFWNEVPAEQHESLRRKVLEQIITSALGPRLVITKLCVALSALALNSMPDVWPNPVDSLIMMFQEETTPLSCSQRCTILLEILTVLPEQFAAMNLNNARQSVLRNELNHSMSKILALLTNLMNPNSPNDVYEHSLKCFSSWVEFGIPMNEAEQIIIQVFQSLPNCNLFDTAVDTLVNVFSHPDSHRYPYTIQKLIPLTLQLQGLLTSAIIERDMDTCQGVTQIVIALAENHTKLILEVACSGDDSKKSDTCKLISLVLECCSIPGHYPVDETCSNMTFTFWYILQDSLQDLEKEKYQMLLPLFQPLYFGLIENLLIKVQYPPDEIYCTWSCEEKEQFRCYRQDIGDTMMYAYSILREPLLGYLCDALSALVRMNKELDIKWELMEAVFFLFGSVAENVDLEENLYLPCVIELLPKLPFTNIKFISTALSMLGSFGEWMSYHPQSLQNAVPLLLQGLGNAEVAQASTMALKDITRENLEHIKPFIPQIVQASQSALERGNLKFRENIRLMSCIGQVLSVLPFSQIMQHLQPILTPHIQQLQQLSKEQPSAAVKNSIVLKLNMLTWLFASLDTEREHGGDQSVKQKQGPKPVFVILQQVALVLRNIVSTWIQDAGVIEAICELFKRSLQTLMDDFSPLAKDVAELLSQMYQTVPHIAILDLTKLMITMFHNDKEYFGIVKALLQSICKRTLDLCQEDLHQYTDIVEAFMILLSQVVKKSKKVLFESDIDINGLFQEGIMGIALPENNTVKASCSFLIELISQTDIPAVQGIVMSQGEILLDRIMRAIGGESSRMIMEHIADVLFTLCKNYLEQMRSWSHDFISKDGYPSERCTRVDKERFTKSLLRERVSKSKVRELVKEFTLQCRGLLGTEYASQMVALI